MFKRPFFYWLYDGTSGMFLLNSYSAYLLISLHVMGNMKSTLMNVLL